MKPDYKNWVPKSMVYGLAGRTVIAFLAFPSAGSISTFWLAVFPVVSVWAMPGRFRKMP